MAKQTTASAYICAALHVFPLAPAGHDTSSNTLTNALAQLQHHPEVTDKLRQEQQVLVARHGPQITPAVLREMTYADAVIRQVVASSRINAFAVL